MTTMQTTPRPSPAAPARAPSGPQGGPGGGGGAGAGPSVDPVRLLRQYKLTFFVASVIGLIVGLSAYYTLLRFAPQYRSSVMYLATPPIGRITDPNRPTIDPQELDRFMQTEIRVMTSAKLLREACQERRLVQGENLKWAKQFQTPGSTTLNLNAAVRDLADRVGAKVVAGSQLMELSVSGPTVDDAEMLAIALHKAYFEELRKRLNMDSGERRDTLEAKRIQNDKELIKAQTEIQEQIGNMGLDSLTASDTVVSRDIDLAQNKLVELQGAKTRYEEDVKRMERELADEGGLKVGADIRDEAERDPSAVSIKNDIANLNAIMAAKIKTLGPNNPDVKKIQFQIEAKQKEVDKSIEEAKTRIFHSRLEQTRQLVNGLTVQIETLTDTVDKKTLKKVEYLKATKDIQTKTDLIAQLTETKKEIRDALDALATDDGKDVRRGRVRLLDDPKRPDEVSFPKLSIMLALGLFLSLGLTGSVVILREVLDQRIKGPSDITIMPRMKLLGMVPIAADDPSKPGAPETAFRDSASGAIAESFRQMRPAIVKRMAQAGHKSLLIAGAMPQSGSTTVAANFAMACAAADQRVLLIDANFRRPALHKIFKLGEGPGLGEVLCRKNSVDEAVQQTSVPNLHLLASGTPTARSVPERLATEAMTDVIREAGTKYDLVIVDTAPMMVAGDGLALSNRCDCVLLVVRAMAEKRGLVARIRDQLSEGKGEFIGAVVNAVRASTGGYMKRNMRTSYEYHNNGATV